MPTQVKIIRASEFLIATPHGQIDFASSKRLLLTIASNTADVASQKLLLDMRDTQSELSAADLWHLAEELSRRHTVFRGKIAVLCRSTGANQGAFFALCAQNRGFPVNAFTSFEEAVEWLLTDEPQLLEDLG
jgi:hypothetical protein